MAQARGTQVAIGLFEETTYATTPATPAGQKLYVTSCSLSGTQNRIDSDTLQSNRTRDRPAAGNINVSGTLEMELHAESMGTLIKHTLGSVATTGSNPYHHAATIGSLPVGLEIEVDYGSNISGSGRFVLFKGCRIAGATFRFPQEGYCTASVDVVGASSTLGSATIDAAAGLTDNGCTPFSAHQSTITEGGASIAYVQSVEMRIDNGLDLGTYVIGGAGVRRSLPEGFATVSGTLTALFESPALLTKAVDSTETSLTVTIKRGDGLGSSGNESMVFRVEEMMYDRADPGVQGPGGILLTLPFRGYADATYANKGFAVSVYNAVATV